MNILIAYFSIGSAHKRMATSLAEYYQSCNPQDTVKLLDFISDFNIFHFKNLPNMSMFITSNTFSSFLYDRAWHANKYVHSPIYEALLSAGISPLSDVINSFKPDVAITTHVAATNIIAAYKKQHEIHIPHLISVVTDFVVGEFWPLENVDTYITPSASTQNILAQRGFSKKHIHVLGMPTHPAFLKKQPAKSRRKKYSITDGQPVILVIMGGAAGTAYSRTISKTKELLEQWLAEKRNARILICTGKNKTLKDELESSLNHMCNDITIYGFRSDDEMAEMISISDLVITKASGLTISEVLGSNAALLLIPPFWGQEKGNAVELSSQGCAFTSESTEDAVQFLTQFTTKKTLRVRMQNKAKLLSKPSATKDITELIHSVSLL